MPDDWSKTFWKPIHPRDAKPIETLAQARAFMLALPPGAGMKPEWQRAIEAVMAAAKAKTGGMHAAHDALINALFINAMLDVNHD